MQDLDRLRTTESKIIRAERGTEQPKVRLVQVRLVLLSQLEDLQKRLDAYITGYISSRELSDLCAKVGSRLELGKKEKHRLWDPVYWEDIRDDLTRTYETTIGLTPLIREDFKEQIEEFEEKLQDMITAVSGPMRSPNGADVIDIANRALRSIGSMQHTVEPITVQSKQNAHSVLTQIGNVIHRIFERIEVFEEQLVSEPSQQLVGYEAKIQQEGIERERELRGEVVGRAEEPAPETKTTR